MAIAFHFFLPFLAFWIDLTVTYNHHRNALDHPLHQRNPQATNLPAATITLSSALPAQSKVLSDIAEILDGLQNLPTDLQSFFQQLQGDISQLKDELDAILKGLGSGGLSAVGTTTPQSDIGLPVGFPIPSVLPITPGTVILSTDALASSSWQYNDPESAVHVTPTSTFTSTIHVTRTTTVQRGVSSILIGHTGSRPIYGAPAGTGATSTRINGSLPVSSMPVIAPIPVQSPAVFNRNASDNIAAYYVLSAAPDANSTLSSMQLLCDDPAIDIVNLGFVETSATLFASGDLQPGEWQINIPCGSDLDCSAVGAQASLCQSKGKLVFLSLLVNSMESSLVQPSIVPSRPSGAVSNPIDEFANIFVSTLMSSIKRLNFVTDGIDIYPNSSFVPSKSSSVISSTKYLLSSPYDTAFVKALRQYTSNFAKTFYISAAPRCDSTEPRLSLEALRLIDFVYVRYFDTPGCSLKDPSLDLGSSLHQWSSDLLGLTNGTDSTPAEFPGPGSSSAIDKGPRLFFGGLAPNGSIELDDTVVSRWQNLYRSLNPVLEPDQGGVMLWGAPEDIERGGRTGETFAAYAKGQVGCLDANFRTVPCSTLSG